MYLYTAKRAETQYIRTFHNDWVSALKTLKTLAYAFVNCCY